MREFRPSSRGVSTVGGAGSVPAGAGMGAAASGAGAVSAAASGTRSFSGAEISAASPAPTSSVISSKTAGCCTVGCWGSGSKSRPTACGYGCGKIVAGGVEIPGANAAVSSAPFRFLATDTAATVATDVAAIRLAPALLTATSGRGGAGGGGAKTAPAPKYGAAGACHSPLASTGALTPVGHWLRPATGSSVSRGATNGFVVAASGTAGTGAAAASNSASPIMRDCSAGMVAFCPAVNAGSTWMPGPSTAVASASAAASAAAGAVAAVPVAAVAGVAVVSAATGLAGAAEVVLSAALSPAGRCGYIASTGCCAASWYTSGRVGGRAAPPSTATVGSASSQARSRTEKSGGVVGKAGREIARGPGPGQPLGRELTPNATADGPDLSKKTVWPRQKKLSCAPCPPAEPRGPGLFNLTFAALAFYRELLYGYHHSGE